MSVNPPEPDKANIQGIIYSGFSSFKSCHLIYRFTPGTSNVNGFVSALMPKVQSAQDWGDNKPKNFINIGFTFTGLKATAVPQVQFDIFPLEYRLGATNYYSQQTLCDLGTSSPANWTFGNDTADRKVDCIVHCYGVDDTALDELIGQVSDVAATCRIREVIPENYTTSAPIRYRCSPDLTQKFIHFGFRDGMNEPHKKWPEDWSKNSDAAYANSFLVGHPKSDFFPGPFFYEKPDHPTGKFAKDGCYNVFRVFYKDVKTFEYFLSLHAPAVAQRLGRDEEYAKEWIAAKMNGRWRKGSPLVLSPDEHDPATALASEFDYTQDKTGIRCPIASHTRVTNPRDQAVFKPDMPVPQILRRGTAYGSIPAAPGYEGDQGLIGMFLCGSIGQQFEKLNAWINANNFSPVFIQSTQDALIANRLAPHALRTFTIPMEEGDPVVFDMSDFQFVITRGTAYCFLPSISALKMIAETRV